MPGFPPFFAAEIADACGADPGFLCELLFDATGNETVAELGEFLIRPFKVILILLAAWIVTRIVHRVIDRTVKRLIASQEERYAEAEAETGTDEDETPGRLAALRDLAERRTARNAIHLERGKQRAGTLGAVLRSGASLIIYTIAAFMALGEFDINLGPLIASAGIVGIALGFGAQSLVRDFLTGIFMLAEDQYGVGDIVDLGEANGVVEEVKLRTTKIRDVNGTLWHIPNGEIHRVANKSQEWARAVLDIDVAYDTDIAHAMTVIKRVADSVWDDALENATVLEEPEMRGIETFAENSITMRLVLKVEPSEQFAVAREVRRRLKKAFDQEGIEMPFPQRTIWVHQVEPTVAVATTAGAETDRRPIRRPEGDFGD